MRLLSFMLVTGAVAPCLAQQPDAKQAVTLALAEKIPVDPKIKIGRLPNGLRYYIRKNAKPENRAQLRLVVDAGSILENANQLGYAHFIEHTAFNGTKHFAKNDLVSYLNSIGVRFGADLNAHTGFDVTEYILPIPTDTARIVEQAFTILEDWAHGQVFDSAEVIGERGVVREEWRGRKGAGERMQQQWLPVALKGSLYATRLPIGTEQSIMAATPGKLRPFYRAWYRPDLMAVVAVGDFDPAVIEAQIKKHFSGIAANPKGPPRVHPGIPDNKTPIVAIASDKEATTTSVGVYFKQPGKKSVTVADYRRDLIGFLYLSMLNDRLGEITQKPDAPFTGASASKGSLFTPKVQPFSLNATVKDGGVERGLEALLLEAKRVDQFGFLPSELERAKTDLVRAYEVAYAERDKSHSADLADEYVRNFLQAEPIPGIAYEYDLVRKHVPSITVDEVNRLAASWITDDNRIVIVGAPIKDNVPLPTEAAILAVFDKAASQPVTAYTESVSSDALVSSTPRAGGVVARRSIPGVGVSEWRLSNGARVLVKPTDFKADEILFSAYSPGGSSLASDADYMSASFASQISRLSGLGNVNLIDLNKKLAGKNARVVPVIAETTEGLTGSASPKDLETLLQLVYLNFTGARLDTTAWAAMKNNVASFLANRGSDPNQVFNDTVTVTLGQHGPRARPLTAASFGEIDPNKAIAFFKDRFADAGDFTFLFVGSVDTLALQPLVERYLASLPSAGRKDTPRAASLSPPSGSIQKTVRKGVENKAKTYMIFTGPCVYAPENRFAIRSLVDAFELRLIETLREKLGGVYSPSVSGGCSRTPRQEYSLFVGFDSSPENVEPLTQAVMALIDTIQTQGPTTADLAKVREQLIRGREVDLKTNGFWVSNIAGRDQAAEDIAGLLGAYDDMLKKLTAAQIQEAAKKYFNKANYIRFVLLPENK